MVVALGLTPESAPGRWCTVHVVFISTEKDFRAMLVLSRCVDDGIVIGEDVEIRVVSISGSTVRLGISAPADVRIDRSEVFVQIAIESAVRRASVIRTAKRSSPRRKLARDRRLS